MSRRKKSPPEDVEKEQRKRGALDRAARDVEHAYKVVTFYTDDIDTAAALKKAARRLQPHKIGGSK